jgi:hypothetical protein
VEELPLENSSASPLLYFPGTLNSLPSSRYFRDQPLLHPDVTDRHLVVWYFEDWLKKYFFSLLQILEVRLESFTMFDRAAF